MCTLPINRAHHKKPATSREEPANHGLCRSIAIAPNAKNPRKPGQRGFKIIEAKVRIAPA